MRRPMVYSTSYRNSSFSGAAHQSQRDKNEEEPPKLVSKIITRIRMTNSISSMPDHNSNTVT